MVAISHDVRSIVLFFKDNKKKKKNLHSFFFSWLVLWPQVSKDGESDTLGIVGQRNR